MEKKKLKKTEEKATIYFGTMFLLSLSLDFIGDDPTPLYSLAGGIISILIVIVLILGIVEVGKNQESKKEICNNNS